jgi:hypothetical protein
MNIARRMLFNGEYFYSTHSPKMTVKEFDELSRLGFRIQSEWPHPPESRMYYMMNGFEDYNIKIYNENVVSCGFGGQ